MTGRPRKLAAGVFILLYVAIGFFAGCQSPIAKPPKSETARLDVFLLAGQSNMAGRGMVEEFDRLPIPNLFALDPNGEWKRAAEPLHYDRPQRAGVGPGSMFGRVVAEAYPRRKIGLVPAACGGSPIEKWSPGAYHRSTGSYPYDDAISRAKTAMNAGELRAILWIQGESDSTEERAPLYYERLKALIVALRKDLNAGDVPFIIGELPRFSEVPKNSWRTQVSEAHKRLARELPQVYFVEMPLLAALPDGIHADAPSSREMGRRLGATYLRLVNSNR